MHPVIFRADASRLVLRLPLVALGSFAVGAAVGIAAGSPHSWSLLVMATIAFGYLRFWAMRTRLTMDAKGVALSMPLSSWHVPWAGIAYVGVTSFLSPTHRGGIGAGVILRMLDGSARSIPDVFPVRRNELAVELARGRADHGPGQS